MKQKNVLIVGGGFAGVKAALDLAKHNQHFKITLLSDTLSFNYHPTLYHTATGGSKQISELPLSEILKDSEVDIILDHAEILDRTHRTIKTTKGTKYHYDILILALGAVTNYFGIKACRSIPMALNLCKKQKS